MFMNPPPALLARSRFADWPLAVKSIIGFWSFYALTIVLRAFLAPNPFYAISDKVMNIAVGVGVTGLIYLAIAGLGSRANIRGKTAIAAVACLIGAMLMSGTLAALEGDAKSMEESRYQAREG